MSRVVEARGVQRRLRRGGLGLRLTRDLLGRFGQGQGQHAGRIFRRGRGRRGGGRGRGGGSGDCRVDGTRSVVL